MYTFTIASYIIQAWSITLCMVEYTENSNENEVQLHVHVYRLVVYSAASAKRVWIYQIMHCQSASSELRALRFWWYVAGLT